MLPRADEHGHRTQVDVGPGYGAEVGDAQFEVAGVRHDCDLTSPLQVCTADRTRWKFTPSV